MKMYSTRYDSPLGELMLASDGESLTGLWMDGQKYHGSTLFKDIVEKDDLPVFEKTEKWLNEYFAGNNPPIADVPLAPIGKKYQQDVWKMLCDIPYGTTTSYGKIKNKIIEIPGNERMTSRLVGSAVGHNPISIIIPCHRVVGFDGNLTGYAGGLDRKVLLLDLEGADISRLYRPKY